MSTTVVQCIGFFVLRGANTTEKQDILRLSTFGILRWRTSCIPDADLQSSIRLLRDGGSSP